MSGAWTDMDMFVFTVLIVAQVFLLLIGAVVSGSWLVVGLLMSLFFIMDAFIAIMATGG